MKHSDFTLAQGLAVQQEQLAIWQTILKPKVFQLLHNHIIFLNQRLQENYNTGYDVFRGVDISNWIENFAVAQSAQ